MEQDGAEFLGSELGVLQHLGTILVHLPAAFLEPGFKVDKMPPAGWLSRGHFLIPVHCSGYDHCQGLGREESDSGSLGGRLLAGKKQHGRWRRAQRGTVTRLAGDSSNTALLLCCSCLHRALLG